MKEMQKMFQEDRPKKQPESFFIAKHNDENQTGMAIAAQLLKTQLFLRNTQRKS